MPKKRQYVWVVASCHQMTGESWVEIYREEEKARKMFDKIYKMVLKEAMGGGGTMEDLEDMPEFYKVYTEKKTGKIDEVWFHADLMDDDCDVTLSIHKERVR
jgi:hypothetical protein